MISTVALIIFSLLLVNILIFVQSSPIKNALLQRSSHVVGTSKINDMKKKRNINDDINIKNKLYSKIKETPTNVDKSMIFIDVKMNSNEFKNFIRKRRNDRRPKRDLSTDDFYNNPFYWYPSLSKRSIPSSFYEPKEWNGIHPVNNDFYEYEIPFLVDDEDDENDYEYNRYPILSDLSDVPYDNLQLQQEYNIEDLPLDDDDDELFSTRYGPIEDYFK